MKDKTKALLYILFSTISFSIMGLFVRYIQDLPVIQKVFFRNSISFILALFLIIKSKPVNFTSYTGKMESQFFLLTRSVLGFIGVFLNFYAITHLKLADSQILNRLSPIWVTIVAVIFLKESYNRNQIFSIILALVGAIFVIKPQFSMDILPGISGIASGITAGVSYTILRYLRGKEKPETIIFYFSFFSIMASFPLMIFNYIPPSMTQLIMLLLTGLFASFGQLGLTYGFRYAEAGKVSIFTYTGIIFSTLIGFIVWKEIPDLWSILGGLLILASALINYLRSISQSQS
jgi:drug/metabolite transporter (DMT)-like permease